MRGIKTQEEKNKEFVWNTIESHIKFLTEKRDTLKISFVRYLDTKAVAELLPDDTLVQEAHEDRERIFQSANCEYFAAQTDFYQVLQRLTRQYPNIYIDQDSYRNDWLFTYQYFEKWYKEYRMGKI